MGFLGKGYVGREAFDNKSRSVGTSLPLPSLSGQTAPSGISARAVMPDVCPHCGKNPNRPPPVTDDIDVKAMLEEISEADELTQWEEDFIADQIVALEKYKSLTPKQMTIVNRIYDERIRK